MARKKLTLEEKSDFLELLSFFLKSPDMLKLFIEEERVSTLHIPDNTIVFGFEQGVRTPRDFLEEGDKRGYLKLAAYGIDGNVYILDPRYRKLTKTLYDGFRKAMPQFFR